MLEFLTGTYGVRGRTIVGTESGKDEIAKLNLLRLAVRPAYLFACYKSLADGYDWSTQKCECLSPGAGTCTAVILIICALNKGHFINRQRSRKFDFT